MTTRTYLSDISSKLMDKCLVDDFSKSADGSGCDNMTCIIVLLNQDAAKLEEELAKCPDKKDIADDVGDVKDDGKEVQEGKRKHEDTDNADDTPNSKKTK